MAEAEISPKSQLKPLDQEAQPKGDAKRGGWITIPFIAASMLGLGLAINGTSTNLQIYLIKKYNVEGIDAAQIASIVRGSLNFVPLAGAILSDSYFGCFPVILAGAAINVLPEEWDKSLGKFTEHYACRYSTLFCSVTNIIVKDYKEVRPSQELVAKDLHGTQWRSRHIYRGVEHVVPELQCYSSRRGQIPPRQCICR